MEEIEFRTLKTILLESFETLLLNIHCVINVVKNNIIVKTFIWLKTFGFLKKLEIFVVVVDMA